MRRHRRIRHAVVAVGVITVPLGRRSRDGARSSWLLDESVRDGRVAVRFVLGDIPCARSAVADESARYGDFAFVAAPDCLKGFSSEKVHAWYQYALTAFPSSPWLAKMEDDGIVRPDALLVDLSMLRQATYYGIMRWSGHCMHPVPNALCRGLAGCYSGGSFASIQQGACVPLANCYGNWGDKCCEPACPGGVRMAPFACGPLEVRRASLASKLANCEAASEHMRNLSFVSNATGVMCGSTDGSQGEAMDKCLDEIVIADGTNARFSMTGLCTECSRCGRGVVLVNHPMKNKPVAEWQRVWLAMTRTNYTPPPLYEYALRYDRGAHSRRPRLRALSRTLPATPNNDSSRYWYLTAQDLNTTHCAQALAAERARTHGRGLLEADSDTGYALTVAEHRQEQPSRALQSRQLFAIRINCSAAGIST